MDLMTLIKEFLRYEKIEVSCQNDLCSDIMNYLKSYEGIYNIQKTDFMKIIEELKTENRSELLPVIYIFEQIFMKYELINAERDRAYFKSHRNEDSLNIVFNAVNSNKQGEKDIEVTLYDKEMSEIEGKPIYKIYNLKAYFMDSIDLEIVKLYAQDIDKFEGYEFEFEEDISKLQVPCCYHNYVSDYFEIKGNHMDSNCDVVGSQYGVKAESLYFICLTDLDKLIGIPVKYWCI